MSWLAAAKLLFLLSLPQLGNTQEEPPIEDSLGSTVERFVGASPSLQALFMLVNAVEARVSQVKDLFDSISNKLESSIEKPADPVADKNQGPEPTWLLDGPPLSTDSSGWPLGEDGQPLPTFPGGMRSMLLLKTALPTDEKKDDLVSSEPLSDEAFGSVHDVDGQHMLTDSQEHALKEDGQTQPTFNGGMLPVKAFAVLPTDAKKEDMVSNYGALPTDKFRLIEPDGDSLEAEEWPFDPATGELLPTDSLGNYIYPALDPTESELSTDVNQGSISTVVDTYGASWLAVALGAVLNNEGQPIDSHRHSSNEDQIEATDASRQFLLRPKDEAATVSQDKIEKITGCSMPT